MTTLEMIRLDKKKIKAEDYLKYSESDKKEIKKIKFIPPDFYDDSFGMLEITFNHPIYEMKV